MTATVTAAPAQFAGNPVACTLDPIVRNLDSTRSFDPVRARVRCASLVTNAERMQAEETAVADAQRRRNRAPLGVAMLADTRLGNYVQSLHPGDIVYWVAGLCGACLLLIKATI